MNKEDLVYRLRERATRVPKIQVRKSEPEEPTSDLLLAAADEIAELRSQMEDYSVDVEALKKTGVVFGAMPLGRNDDDNL